MPSRNFACAAVLIAVAASVAAFPARVAVTTAGTLCADAASERGAPCDRNIDGYNVMQAISTNGHGRIRKIGVVTGAGVRFAAIGQDATTAAGTCVRVFPRIRRDIGPAGRAYCIAPAEGSL